MTDLRKSLLLFNLKYSLIFYGSITLIPIILILILLALVMTKLPHNFNSVIEGNLLKINANANADLEIHFSSAIKLFTGGMSVNFEDALSRKDNPFGSITSHYNWQGQYPDAVFSPDYNAFISWKYSSYNIAGVTYDQLPSQPQSVKDVVSLSASTDYLFQIFFKFADKFLAGYIGNAMKFLRYFPFAFNPALQNQYINYDPTTDDAWYTPSVAVNSPPNRDYIFTPPYYDAIARRLMITATENLYDVNNNTPIGVFGSDLTLNGVHSLLRGGYLGSSSFLFDTNSGGLIASSDFEVIKLITYTSISTPPINNAWANILRSQNVLIENGGYYFIGSPSFGSYIIITTVPKQNVENQYRSIVDSAKKSVGIVVGATLGGLVIVCMFYVLVSNFVSSKMIRPISNFGDNLRRVLGNYGSGDNLFENQEYAPVESGEGFVFDELRDMNERMSLKFTEMRNAKTEIPINPIFGIGFGAPSSSHPEMFETNPPPQPSAPPVDVEAGGVGLIVPP